MKILSLFMTSYCSLNSTAKNPSLRVSGLSNEYSRIVSLMFTAGLLLLLLLLPPNIILIFQPAAHGTDISTGNQPGIPSLPPAGAPPDAGNTNSPSPVCSAPEVSQSYGQDNTNHGAQNGPHYTNTGIFSNYSGLALAGGHDRNHNTAVVGAHLVTKLGDGTEYREAYQGYNEQQHQQQQQARQSQQPAPAAVK